MNDPLNTVRVQKGWLADLEAEVVALRSQLADVAELKEHAAWGIEEIKRLRSQLAEAHQRIELRNIRIEGLTDQLDEARTLAAGVDALDPESEWRPAAVDALLAALEEPTP